MFRHFNGSPFHASTLSLTDMIGFAAANLCWLCWLQLCFAVAFIIIIFDVIINVVVDGLNFIFFACVLLLFSLSSLLLTLILWLSLFLWLSSALSSVLFFHCCHHYCCWVLLSLLLSVTLLDSLPLSAFLMSVVSSADVLFLDHCWTCTRGFSSDLERPYSWPPPLNSY